MHCSETELPVFSSLTLLIEPCGLWHDEHDILPSRTGMCATARSVLATCSRWQVAHTSVCVVFTSWCSTDFGLWTLWHVVQVRFRRSCALPSHPTWSVRLWHVKQIWFASAGFMSLIFGMCPLASSSTCAWPGPWQLSQPCVAAGDRGFFAWPWGVPFSASPCSAWHSRHFAVPT